MLIQTPHEAKALNPEEGLAKLKEENAALDAQRKFYKQEELEDTERSAGPRLSYQEILRRLAKCNSNLVVKDGAPGNVALYCDVLNEEGQREQKYVGGFPKQPIPEYGYITVDERGLPHREVRGWRSVLIRLVEAKVITYRSTVQHFGAALGQRAWRWNEAMQPYK